MTVRDPSIKQDGLVRFGVKGSGGSITLPAPSATRASVVLGAPAECAAVVFNPPSGTRPRCRGDAARIVCR